MKKSRIIFLILKINDILLVLWGVTVYNINIQKDLKRSSEKDTLRSMENHGEKGRQAYERNY